MQRPVAPNQLVELAAGEPTVRRGRLQPAPTAATMHRESLDEIRWRGSARLLPASCVTARRYPVDASGQREVLRPALATTVTIALEVRVRTPLVPIGEAAGLGRDCWPPHQPSTPDPGMFSVPSTVMTADSGVYGDSW